MPLLIKPHEGYTLEYVFAPLRLTLFQPLLTGATLFVLTKKQSCLAKVMSPSAIARITTNAIVKTVGVLFAIGLLRVFNHTMTRRAVNNKLKDEWKYGEEIIVITGGSGGIGESIALKMAPYSKAVIVLDLMPSGNKLPDNIYFYQCDITDPLMVINVANKIRQNHGDPTVLINNAGTSSSQYILDMDEELYRRTFDVNIISHFTLTKQFLPAMIEANHGHVVTLASVASFLCSARMIDYACTKAATLAFHEGLSCELRQIYNAPKVRTTVVHPYWARTKIAAAVINGPNFKDFVLEPATISDSIAQQLLKAESAQLILPGRFTFLALLRGLPTWLARAIVPAPPIRAGPKSGLKS
ncbi:putative oxidoreductase,short chain dehydrogenase [Lipomyces arxii]|uniref:putative oxidoreductase,short chain dehydrogenase n=1 Tax=Lipomyces arxii TaxID=56418 RepID=UPI0034CD3CC4